MYEASLGGELPSLGLPFPGTLEVPVLAPTGSLDILQGNHRNGKFGSTLG